MTNFEKMTKKDFIEIFGKVINDAYDAYENLEIEDLREGSYCEMCPITKSCRGHLDCRKNLKEWADEKEKILDDVEKGYLKAVLAPWLKRKDVEIEIIKYVSCTDAYYWLEFNLYYKNRDDNDGFSLPVFYSKKMYAGMKIGTYYTVEELGLR